jgi:ABC-2 type transport system ATP-binding protein
VDLIGSQDRVRIVGSGDVRAAAEAVGELPSVVEAGEREGGIDLIVDGAAANLTEILQKTTSAGTVVTSVDVDEPDLESVFLHLTGRALRD